MSSGATMIARIFLPSIRKVKDPMSGFFLVRRRVIEGVELKPIGYKILLETLAKGKNSEVKEIPYTFEQRALGESNLSLREQLNYLEHVFILASKEREIRRFLQFAIIGGSGILVNMGMLLEASIISNFILNDIWTFRDRRVAGVKAKLIRALKFNLISIVGAAIQYGLYIAFTDLVGLHYLISMLIGITAALTWNFSMNTFWTWRRR
jgi:dolichol-phosphate mannosyltransferase